MKKIKTNSLRFRMVALLFIMMLLLFVLVAYNNYSAYTMLLKRVQGNTEDTAALYQKHLDDILKQNQTYLYTMATDNLLLKSLPYAKKTSLTGITAWHSSLVQLKNTLDNAMNSYSVDGLFFYLPSDDYYITSNKQNNLSAMNIRRQIIRSINEGQIDLSAWTTFTESGNHYLFRVLYLNNVYVGAWIEMDTLLDKLAQKTGSTMQLYFTTADGNMLRNGQDALIIPPPKAENHPPQIEMVENHKMLVVLQPLKEAALYLTLLIPASDFTSFGAELIQVIIAVSACALLMWLIWAVALKKWILSPVKVLTLAIDKLRAGNLNAYVPAANQLDEFQKMTTAFNDMVSEIKDLKIDVYERKLQKQRLEAQYLKQQITPHFLVNCLNTAYQLTETNHFDLSQKMLKDLSRHLRFILSSGQTVTLGEELQLVANYIELSGIRYPDCIRYFCHCPEELYDATVIPLLLLNFVENTIKYEVRMGQLLEIHIDIKKSENEHGTVLQASLWDTGSGFDTDILEKLQNIDAYLDEESGHIGITNVLHRARHVYENPCFHFSNRPQAGAQIDIELPYMPFKIEITPKRRLS